MPGWTKMRTRSMRRRAYGVCLTCALGGALATVSAAPARAEECPNASLRTGVSAHLADCRAYELVSPTEKNSEDAFGEGALAHANASGTALAYTSKNVFAQSPGASVETAYVGSSESGEWLTSALAPRVLQPLPGDTVTYPEFSSEDSQAVLRVPLEALTPEAIPGVYNLYLRDAGGAYSLITAAAPSEAVPGGCDTCYGDHDVPAFAGASSDLTHVIFEANERLLTTPSYPADSEHREDLYESDLAEPVGQRVHPLGILPDGTLASGAQPGAGGGNVNAEEIAHLDHAISSDESRILFTAEADEGAPTPAQHGLRELYDRIGGPAGKTIEISTPAAGAMASQCTTPNDNCKPEPAQFWDASEDGSVVLFTSKAELTPKSNTGPMKRGEANRGNDLYSYDLEDETLTDLTFDAGEADGAEVQGVVGASSTGADVYFVAHGVLAGANSRGAKAVAGKDNLYLHEAQGPRTVFIATLAEPAEEEPAEEGAPPHGGDSADWTSIPEESQAYVTPSGSYLAFTSLLALTGYDNEDQQSEQPDKEVFEYEAPSEALQCASCNPDPGTRPIGSAFIGREIGAQSERISPLYQPRALSGEGSRLFFSSSDSLLAESGTPYVKVYEFEDGAVHLTSGGSSEDNDIFMDASESGDDVFFASAQALATNADEATNVYDARVDGGHPPPPTPPLGCQGEGCLPAETPAVQFVHPGSLLEGVGNVGVEAAHSSKPPARATALTRAQKLARALKSCKRQPKRKRAGCIKLAERRYGPKKRSNSAHRSSSGAEKSDARTASATRNLGGVAPRRSS
jgi:hypothetical protein